MTTFSRQMSAGSTLVAGSILCANLLAAEIDPADWLNRMGAAVQSTSYEGTVIRIHDGFAEALKVVHTVENGVVREKVVAQEGSGLEIIRNGNEVHHILPERRSVLVEEWDDRSTLFSTLPSSEIRLGNEYDVAIVDKDRIAGREALKLAIRQHDKYRYGHRIWLDTETGFPLQTQLIAEDGAIIEQVMFADIVINHDIEAAALSSSYSTDQFTWFTPSAGHQTTDIRSRWNCEQLPDGFRAVSTHEEEFQGNDEPVTHILFSDGLASVSVFITANSGKMIAGAARVGGSNSYSVEYDDFEVTAIGEVPAITVEQIAKSMLQF